MFFPILVFVVLLMVILFLRQKKENFQNIDLNKIYTDLDNDIKELENMKKSITQKNLVYKNSSEHENSTPGKIIPIVNSVQPQLDMSQYVHVDLIPKQPDMSKYILKTTIVPSPDMSKYILKTSIPKCSQPKHLYNNSDNSYNKYFKQNKNLKLDSINSQNQEYIELNKKNNIGLDKNEPEIDYKSELSKQEKFYKSLKTEMYKPFYEE